MANAEKEKAIELAVVRHREAVRQGRRSCASAAKSRWCRTSRPSPPARSRWTSRSASAASPAAASSRSTGRSRRGKTTLTPARRSPRRRRRGGVAAFIDAEHALDVGYARKLGVRTDDLLISQPDTGEQALEICEMLVRSGAVDVIVIDSVAALVPRAELEGEMGDAAHGPAGAPDVPGAAQAHRHHLQAQTHA